MDLDNLKILTGGLFFNLKLISNSWVGSYMVTCFISCQKKTQMKSVSQIYWKYNMLIGVGRFERPALNIFTSCSIKKIQITSPNKQFENLIFF